jgi:replication factor A1
MIAGDETGDTNFIMFGKFVQRLTKKSVVMLIAENPQDFIPNEITRLLEKTFKWNISFTQNTITSSKICFQVNAIVGGMDDTDSLLPVTPTASQSSSLMSLSASSSIQRTPQKSVAFPSPSKTGISLATHASSATPTKNPLNIPEPHLTPQSRRYLEVSDDDQVSYPQIHSVKTSNKKHANISSYIIFFQTVVYIVIDHSKEERRGTNRASYRAYK